MAAAIERCGMEAQKQEWLPKMASGELRGGIALTEPDAGTDLQSIRTRADRNEKGYLLNGTKMWITNSPIAQVAIVWAKVDDGNAKSIRGFLVERDFDGFHTPKMHGKMSLRASWTGEIVLENCFVPDANMLPGDALYVPV